MTGCNTSDDARARRREWERAYRRRKRAALSPDQLEEQRRKDAARKRRQMADPIKGRMIRWRKGAPVEGRQRWSLPIERVRDRRAQAFEEATVAHEDWIESLD